MNMVFPFEIQTRCWSEKTVRRKTLSILFSFLFVLFGFVNAISPAIAERAAENAQSSSGPVLKRGSKGEEVTLLQTRLREYGFMNDKADGVFGPKTEEAVKAVQKYLYELEREGPVLGVDTESDRAIMMDQSGAQYELDSLVTADGEMSESETQTPSEAAPLAGNGEYPILYDGSDDDSTPSEEGETVENEYEPNGIVDGGLRFLLLDSGFQVYRQDLKKGMYGVEIRRLQTRLATLGYLEGGIDGVYSDYTASAILSFQERNRLNQTGVADRETHYTLYSPEAKITDNPVYPYTIKISINDQKVYAYAWDDGEYTHLSRAMICSTGMDDTPTPKGVFVSDGPVARWCYFPRYECWTQYAFRIEGSILFHSVLFTEARESTLREGSVATLGRKASHGCVRLSVEDAKWIYDNCKKGTTVEVY